MSKFLTTHATAYQIEEIIRGARSELTLITPYLQISCILLDRLKDADRGGVSLRIVYGKDKLKPTERTKLGELQHLSLLFLHNLHAKCYINEEQAVIASMNMYEFSEKSNREMGVLLTRSEDPEPFTEAQREVASIVAAADSESHQKREIITAAGQATRKRQKDRQGFCIRCQRGVRYSPDTPLCGDCYSSWATWGNAEYAEKRCHRCGERHTTSKSRPLCYTCFQAEPFMPRAPSRLDRSLP